MQCIRCLHHISVTIHGFWNFYNSFKFGIGRFSYFIKLLNFEMFENSWIQIFLKIFVLSYSFWIAQFWPQNFKYFEYWRTYTLLKRRQIVDIRYSVFLLTEQFTSNKKVTWVMWHYQDFDARTIYIVTSKKRGKSGERKRKYKVYDKGEKRLDDR